MFEKKMYINGNLVGNSKQYDIFCPANNKRIGSVAWATEKETHHALDAAN